MHPVFGGPCNTSAIHQVYHCYCHKVKLWFGIARWRGFSLRGRSADFRRRSARPRSRHVAGFASLYVSRQSWGVPRPTRPTRPDHRKTRDFVHLLSLKTVHLVSYVLSMETGFAAGMFDGLMTFCTPIARLHTDECEKHI